VQHLKLLISKQAALVFEEVKGFAPLMDQLFCDLIQVAAIPFPAFFAGILATAGIPAASPLLRLFCLALWRSCYC
jgi:hypothetical protein